MKRFLILLMFLFSISGICFAASSKYDDIVAEYIVYGEIEQNIEDALTKIETIMIEIDSAAESKNNKDIKANIKTVESQMKFVEKQLKAQIMKIKTTEVKQYYDVKFRYFKLYNNFVKDTADVFIKKGKISDSDKETLIKKYAPQFDKLNKEDIEISEVLMDIIRPEQCE